MRRTLALVDMATALVVVVLAIDQITDGGVRRFMQRLWYEPEPVVARDDAPVYGVAAEAERYLKEAGSATT